MKKRTKVGLGIGLGVTTLITLCATATIFLVKKNSVSNNLESKNKNDINESNNKRTNYKPKKESSHKRNAAQNDEFIITNDLNDRTKVNNSTKKLNVRLGKSKETTKFPSPKINYAIDAKLIIAPLEKEITQLEKKKIELDRFFKNNDSNLEDWRAKFLEASKQYHYYDILFRKLLKYKNKLSDFFKQLEEKLFGEWLSASKRVDSITKEINSLWKTKKDSEKDSEEISKLWEDRNRNYEFINKEWKEYESFKKWIEKIKTEIEDILKGNGLTVQSSQEEIKKLMNSYLSKYQSMAEEAENKIEEILKNIKLANEIELLLSKDKKLLELYKKSHIQKN
ncbi:hypothetical protein [Metamycoplasma auris]|uniref:Uncharacterized protein n=1 Tax=Metamycoplasma auris TaxID=51363 RepID=A0A2W7G5E3_9BACT|nr:hypothetical protein [Metamycoplasma auris]PZW01487.1 hypothetical protein BCF89_1012 [Metamycoplasma auris]